MPADGPGTCYTPGAARFDRVGHCPRCCEHRGALAVSAILCARGRKVNRLHGMAGKAKRPTRPGVASWMKVESIAAGHLQCLAST